MNLGNSITLGSMSVRRVTLGSTKIWPADTPYISPAQTLIEIGSGSTAGTISVYSNVSWTATSLSPSWLTVSQTSTGVSWTAATNSGTTARSTEIVFTGSGVTATTTVSQARGYEEQYILTLITTNPLSIESASTGFQVEVESYKGSSRIQPYANVGSNSMSIALQWSGNTTGNRYLFVYTCSANTTSTAKTATITFTQSVSTATTSITINQGANANAPISLSAITVSSRSGDWVFGTYDAGGGSRGIVIANPYPNSVQASHTATISMWVWVHGQPTPSAEQVNNATYSIPAGSTLDGTIPGIWVKYPEPNQSVATSQGFVVS